MMRASRKPSYLELHKLNVPGFDGTSAESPIADQRGLFVDLPSNLHRDIFLRPYTRLDCHFHSFEK